MKSTPSLKLDDVGSKTRPLGQAIEKPCVHSRGHSFDPVLMKLCKNVIFIESRPTYIQGHIKFKTKSLGQILENFCVHTRCTELIQCLTLPDCLSLWIIGQLTNGVMFDKKIGHLVK